MNTKRININELVNLLIGITTPTLAEITVETVMDMNKNGVVGGNKEPNPYYEKITKRKIANVKLCFNYQEMVNDNRAKEGKSFDFVPQARKWGLRVGNSAIITHNNSMYLEATPLKSIETRLFYEGVEINESVLAPYMKARKSSPSQDLEKPVIINDYKLPTIKEIVLADTRYIIE